MHTKLLKCALIAGTLIMIVSMNSFAQNQSPVRIVFDKNSPRIDIVTGKQLPNYTQAQRGSIQFYYGRLDKPEEGFWYFFDGRSFQNIKSVALIRKIPALGAWAILGGGGWQGSDNTEVQTNPISICEIEHHAVSFIPINPSTNKPDPKVYVLLDDLYMIQWKDNINHWVANRSQSELDSQQGIFY
ncbi:hypothetical protein LLG96_05735 [bacterium]|nr:hypothetical protein [bacterium]